MAKLNGEDIFFSPIIHVSIDGEDVSATIVQTTGDSETAVMSQKAVTDELYKVHEEIRKAAGKKTEHNGEIFNDYENNVATGLYSHAEGTQTKATGEAAHAEGRKCQANGKGSHAEGGTSIANGEYAHAEGYYNNANGIRSHAEGNQNNAEGFASHAEGNKTKSYGYASHTEGSQTQAGKLNADGTYDNNYGYGAHAEGESTLALGHRAHAEGNVTQALGDNSHSEGEQVTATGRSQHVQGRCGIEDDTVTEDNPYGTYAHIVGGGTDAYKGRKNIHTLDWEGNARFSGDVYVGADVKGAGGTKLVSVDELKKLLPKQNLADLSSIRYKNEESGFSMTGTAYGAIYYNGSPAFKDTNMGGNPSSVFTIPVGVGRYSIKGKYNGFGLYAEMYYGGNLPETENVFTVEDNEQLEIEVTTEHIEYYGGIMIGMIAPDDELIPHTYHNESLQIEIYKLD